MRDIQFKMMLSEIEKRELFKLAEERGVTASTYLRSYIRKQARYRRETVRQSMSGAWCCRWLKTGKP